MVKNHNYDKIHHYNENSSNWCNFITSKTKIIIHTESYHNNPQWYSFKWGQFWLLVDKYEEIYSNWGKFCIMLNVKFITMMKLHYFDHNSITRLRFRTMMWIYFYNENSSLWWKFIILVKISILDRNSSLWWRKITFMEIYHFDDENSLLTWRFIILVKCHYFGGNLHNEEIVSLVYH